MLEESLRRGRDSSLCLSSKLRVFVENTGIYFNRIPFLSQDNLFFLQKSSVATRVNK